MRVVILFPTLFFLHTTTTALHLPIYGESRSLSDHPHTHSYPPDYTFHRRDGWEAVRISDLDYKYTGNYTTENSYSSPDYHHALLRRSGKQEGHGGGIGGAIKTVVGAAIKGVGNIVLVTITWYTGKDLQNPSCWHRQVWTPTDKSFVCAVTLEGWTNRPQCFKFLELCNGSVRCVFVRVVDTCAGCPKGSKHVDLTKAAFQSLGNLDQGVLHVQMRLATDPKDWHEVLWGPKQT